MKLSFMLASATCAAGLLAVSFPAGATASQTIEDATKICEQTQCPNNGAQVCAIVTVPLPAPAEGTIAYNCYQPLVP